MDDKAKQMIKIKNGCHFEPFSFSAQVPGIAYFSSKNFVDFNSRKSTNNHLLEAIKDGKNQMIGLYGMGGLGKTTLAREVGKKVDELKLFEKFIMVLVSKPPNVCKIQQDIAEQIGLELKEELQSNRAQRLSLGVENKKILIILDDVWSTLNLEEIGILPNENRCILLITRLKDVCDSMRCGSIIELSLLEEEEALTFLKMHAAITSDSLNDFDGVGRNIVDECKGLPIAIEMVGKTLRGKSIVECNSTLRKLKSSPALDIDEGLRGPHKVLESSYDNLPSLLAKSLFLLCSMFPEDHKIHVEDLIRFGKETLELEEIAYTMEDARSEISVSINTLLNSSLLMPTGEQECVTMHDFVRDVALWIAKN